MSAGCYLGQKNPYPHLCSLPHSHMVAPTPAGSLVLCANPPSLPIHSLLPLIGSLVHMRWPFLYPSLHLPSLPLVSPHHLWLSSLLLCMAVVTVACWRREGGESGGGGCHHLDVAMTMVACWRRGEEGGGKEGGGGGGGASAGGGHCSDMAMVTAAHWRRGRRTKWSLLFLVATAAPTLVCAVGPHLRATALICPHPPSFTQWPLIHANLPLFLLF